MRELRALIAGSGILTILILALSGCGGKRAISGEEVVATFADQAITVKELKEYSDRASPHPEGHRHGMAHYENFIRRIAFERILEKLAREREIDKGEEVRKALRAAMEGIHFTQYHQEMLRDRMKVKESEIQEYYRENKEHYKDRQLDEVRERISEIIKMKKHADYMPEYLEELKKNAVIRKNYQLLKIEEPDEEELRDYYERYKRRYRRPERIKVDRVETETRERAEEALFRLNSGEDFGDVARKYSQGTYAAQGGKVPGYIVKGQRSQTFDDNVFILPKGGTSRLFEEEGRYYIVRVREKEREGQKSFAEVREEVGTDLLRRKREEHFRRNEGQVLFSIDGEIFTVGDFQAEFERLPSIRQQLYANFEAKKRLLDSAIEYRLLLRDAYRQMHRIGQRGEVQWMRREILSGIVHREEMRKIEVSDEEVKEFYEANKDKFIERLKFLISYIRIGVGQSRGERKRARERIEEAARKLEEGEDFAKVAREYSEDEWLAAKGGRLDEYIYEGKGYPGENVADEEVSHPFHEVLNALEEGEVSGIFEYMNSYYLVKLRKRIEGRQLDFEEAEPYARRFITARKHREYMKRWEEELFEKSNLVINEDVLEAMVEQQ